MRRIRDRIESEGKTLAEFSREIGKGGNYHQVYAWIIDESVEPKTTAGLHLLRWLANSISQSAPTIRAKGSPKKVVKPKK